MTRIAKYKGCPVTDWLETQGLSLQDFALLMDVGYTDVYIMARGYTRVLPLRFQNAIEKRAGAATAQRVAEAYTVWRHGLGVQIGKARA